MLDRRRRRDRCRESPRAKPRTRPGWQCSRVRAPSVVDGSIHASDAARGARPPARRSPRSSAHRRASPRRSERDVQLVLEAAHELGDAARAAVARREHREGRDEQGGPRVGAALAAGGSCTRRQVRAPSWTCGGGRSAAARAAIASDAASTPCRRAHARELALRSRRATRRREPAARCGRAACVVARVEQRAVALDDAVQCLARVEARRRRAVPMRGQRAGAEQDVEARRAMREGSTRRLPSRTDRTRGSRGDSARAAKCETTTRRRSRTGVRASVAGTGA